MDFSWSKFRYSFYIISFSNSFMWQCLLHLKCSINPKISSIPRSHMNLLFSTFTMKQDGNLKLTASTVLNWKPIYGSEWVSNMHSFFVIWYYQHAPSPCKNVMITHPVTSNKWLFNVYQKERSLLLLRFVSHSFH